MNWTLGRLSVADRMQRLSLGAVLMGLNLVGLLSDPTWAKWAALVIQADLIVTALVGCCPVLWGCSARLPRGVKAPSSADGPRAEPGR